MTERKEFKPTPGFFIFGVAGLAGLHYFISTISNPLFEFEGLGGCDDCTRLVVILALSILAVLVSVYSSFNAESDTISQTLSVKTIVAIGIGTALFFLLARFASIPVFANTTLTFQYALLAFFAVLFGPLAGFIIGLAGHVFTDISFGWGLWWSWIIVSGVIGAAFGFIMKGVRVDEGEFENNKAITRFVVLSTLVHLVAWGAIAPVLDILIYAQPANRVFTQGLIAFVGNAITTAIVGTLLILAYSKSKPKAGSLKKD